MVLRKLSSVVSGLAIILLAISYSYASKENIVAAWMFDEGDGDVIHDVSGNSNDGVIIGGAEWVDGKFEQALHFDGSSSHIEIPFHESMKVLNQGDFTFTAWFITDEVPDANRVLFQHLDGNGTGRSWLYIVGGTAEVATHLGGARTPSGVNAEPGQWTHTAVVVTESGGTDTIQVYVNGEPGGAPGRLGMEDSEGIFHMGSHKNPTSNVWLGTIDEVALFDKALSQAEIKSLMARGIVGFQAVDSMGKLAASWGSIKGNTTS